MKHLLIIAAILGVSACSPGISKTQKTINEGEFPGLTELGEKYPDVRLSYDLDKKDGELIHFSSCTDVEKAPAEDVKEDQYPLLNLLKRNCQALKLYFHANSSSASFLPASLSLDFIRALPANAIPDQGGDKEAADTSLGVAQPELTAIATKTNSIEVHFDDLNINYVVLARGDVDHNGIEDMLLGMDWRVASAFGRGFGLLVVEVKEGNVRVIQSY